MKKLVILIAVLAAFAAGAAVVVGNLRARDLHAGLVESLDAESGANVIDDSFSPGLLGSSSVVHFGLERDVEKAGMPVVEFRMENNIQHGALPFIGWLASGASGTPVIANVKTVASLTGEIEKPFIEAMGESPTLEIDTALRSSGMGESTFTMKPLKANGEDAGGSYEFDWQGFDGKLAFTRDYESIVGKFESGGFMLNSAMANMSMGAFSWTVDYETDESGLRVGNTIGRLASVEFRPIILPMPPVAVGPIEISHVSRVENGRFYADLTQRVESVTVDEATWGPGVVNFELGDLDAVAMASLVETFEEVQERLKGGEEGEAFQQELGQKIVESLPQLAAHSPKLEFSEISLGTPQGTVRGKALVDIDGSNAAQLANPMVMIAALRAKASAEAPADLFASMVGLWASSQVKSGKISVEGDFDETVAYVRDSMIHNLRKAGYVVFDGQTYRTRIDWSQGRLTINGLPTDPMELAMLTAQPTRGMEFPEQPSSRGFEGNDSQPPAEFDLR